MRLTALFLALLPLTVACSGDTDGKTDDTGDTDTATDTAADTDTDTDTDSDTDSDTDTDTDTDTDSGTDTGTGIDCSTDKWEDQVGEARGAWMAACVVPVLAPVFQGYDADRYADFGCMTCHPGAGSYDYEMPALFSLDWSRADAWAAEGVYVGDGTGFMEVVVSTMVEVLDEEPYNPETGAGFGCYSCHQP